MQLTSKVTSPFRDLTLIDYLTKRFSYLSREEWLARIAEGRLLYNDEMAHAETVVRQGGRVTYDVPPFPQPDADFNYEIIYGDRWLLAINKPPNLRVHGEGKYMMANLIYHVRHVHEPPYPEATLVNRLDADTSGVVLLARQRDAARALGRLFEQREVEKRYLALVHGIPEPLEGKIDLPIGHVDNPRYRKSGRVPRIGPDAPNAKEAVTYYKTIEQFEKPAQAKSLHPSRKCALVELRPDSGRTHQLRVHMSLIGCPLIGDRLYQLDDDRYVAWRENRNDPQYADLLPRHALHAATLLLHHPFKNEPLQLEAPLAEDMQVLLRQLHRL